VSGYTTATVAVVGAITAAASTAMSVAGQAQASQAAAGQANYQRQVALMNQQVGERNARLAEQQGEADAMRQQQKTSLIEGSQRAALAAQGGDVNVGSPLDILGDTARAGKLDEFTILNNAGLRAHGYALQAANAGGQAGLYGANAANAQASLPFGIGSSLLGGASSLAGKWAGYLGRNPSASRYDLDRDFLRTAGDRDLSGYN
jgi:hypothetical protein